MNIVVVDDKIRDGYCGMDIAVSDNEDSSMDIVVVDDKIRDGYCCMDIVVLDILLDVAVRIL